jgi:AcrR family transcriptional regulator
MPRDIPQAPPDRTLEELIPGGVEPPTEVPPEIFQAALATFLDQRRLDMRALAAELGIGRATLYRKVGNRDRLLGEVLWYLTRLALVRAGREGQGLRGAQRVIATVEAFMTFVHVQPALQRLLDAEPEAALRVLTSKEGPVQRGVVEALERLLADEEAAGRLALTIDREMLAFMIVRIGESFLYADVIADLEPDVATAVEMVRRLLRDPR